MSQTRSVIRWVGSAMMLALLVPGCGGSSSSSVPVQEFPKRLAEVVCDELVGCCRARAMPLDPATCNERATAYYRGEFSKPDPAKVRYDPSAADGCLSAYRNALSGCTFADSEALLSACDPVFVGLVPLGGPCKKSEECAPQSGGYVSCHFGSISGVDGTCALQASSPAAARHGKQGEACDGSCTRTSCEGSAPSGSGVGATSTCFVSDGLYCDGQSTCQPTLADGAACTGAWCKQGSYCADGTCAPKKPDGAVCSGSDQCVTEHCDHSSGGAETSGICGQASIANAKTCAGVFD